MEPIGLHSRRKAQSLEVCLRGNAGLPLPGSATAATALSPVPPHTQVLLLQAHTLASCLGICCVTSSHGARPVGCCM